MEMADQFQKVEQRPWGAEGIMIELSKQVGDLSRHVMVQEKYYLKSRNSLPEYETTKERIADELFDVWFCLVRLADYYGIDFEKTIDKVTKKELENFKKRKIK
jgi:NTP pyrophosphatase (non-canonical NTP hydrolase)